jgi:hypothetical protein
MKYVFFWVYPRRLNGNSRRFGTLYRFHLQRQVNEVWYSVPKCRLLAFRRRGYTQKKTYCIKHASQRDVLQMISTFRRKDIDNDVNTQMCANCVQWLSNSEQIINKMQLCNIIYYSTVHWSQVWVGTAFPLRLDYGRSPHAYVKQRLQIQLELLMMSGVPLETCWAFNERWNNKFYYKDASCWLFLLNHTAMHGSMNTKWLSSCVL